MREGIWYVVTKESDDGTFLLGDHIKFDNGCILCREAGGFINKEGAAIATIGMEYELDREWALREVKRMEEVGKFLEEG